ncbi:hypothetical protein OS493_026224 [Desmophyllum pertusum]|uniref:Myosin light chain kinase n=1 Tax=Desmophyllum pertusum TaxID=174260 RepID=A0A9W9ZPP4_9CNID|nr:hypothetical protein OS493_026224 [Desmophyllum pertusum]
MGLSELEDLQQRYACLEQLYNEAVRARDEAIEERDKATVLIALQLQNETEELNKQIDTLQSQGKKLYEENEDLKIRLGYAKDDLNKLQQRHISLQIEQEQCLQEKDDALALVREFENNKEKDESVVKEGDKQDDEKMASEQTDPAYSNFRDEIFTSASEKDLELEPRPPVTVKKSRLEDVFDVHDEIGKGKFGVVKKVTERSSQTVFAAKYIRLSSSSSGSSRDDIMREINIMNQLHHKRLVGLVDAFDMSRNIVMIMEFVSGGELFERVADADCLTEKEASFYMYQLLQGLQYMHMKNIVHLDLKPENIVCVSKNSWDIKLIDFGLAMELVPGVRMTALKGTPEFMAPEAVNFDTITLATDMWSVGVIAYILLSGLSPLLGEDINETLANVTAVEWDFEDESFDVISDEAKDFIAQLLVKNSRKRNTVKQSLEHEWMKVAEIRQRPGSRAQIVHLVISYEHQSRPSVAPSLATVASTQEEDEEEAGDEIKQDTKEQEHVHNINKEEDVVVEENNEQKSTQPPVFTKELSDISINEGETVTLEVGLENDANCQLEWLKNDVPVTEGQRLSLVNHGEGRYSLAIRDTEDDDAGEYRCVVENEAGRVACTGNCP